MVRRWLAWAWTCQPLAKLCLRSAKAVRVVLFHQVQSAALVKPRGQRMKLPSSRNTGKEPQVTPLGLVFW